MMNSNYLNEKVYDTLDAQARINMASELLENSAKQDFAKALNRIFQMRYRQTAGSRGKIEYIDNFMKIFVDIAFYSKDNPSEKKVKKIREKFMKTYSGSDLVKFRNENELNRELLYCEFRHLCRVYIYSCNESKSYSRYFDLIPIKQSKLYVMIQSDLKRIGITAAQKFGFDEMLPEFISAAEDELDAFIEMAERKQMMS